MKLKRSFFALLILTLAVFTAACDYSLTQEASPPLASNNGQLSLSARSVNHAASSLAHVSYREEATQALSPHGLPFTDVSAGAWFFPYVQFVQEHGVIQGTTATTFAPDANFERAQVVATLFRIYHDRRADAGDSRQTSFSDVPANAWFAPYVAWAYSNGIVEGVGGGRFAPLADVDRQQLATMLYRFADEMLDDVDTTIRQGAQWNRFTDRNRIQSWAVDALTWANYHGIINGRTSATIVPDGTATRAEAAAVLTRFAEVPEPSEENTETPPKEETPSHGSTLCSVDATAAARVIQPTDISWYKQLFNRHNRVGSGFSPPALRTLAGSHVSVDSRIYDPLNQMMSSARAAGATIWAQSGYRPYATQRELFENRVSRYMDRGYSRPQAEQNTALWIAAPGTSEHQSGLAVDFNCITMAFEHTLAFQWLRENAHRYGFILRYPQGTTHITGVNYEPWHFRYVGIEHASKIWEYGVTLEEYMKWYLGR